MKKKDFDMIVKDTINEVITEMIVESSTSELESEMENIFEQLDDLFVSMRVGLDDLQESGLIDKNDINKLTYMYEVLDNLFGTYQQLRENSEEKLPKMEKIIEQLKSKYKL